MRIPTLFLLISVVAGGLAAPTDECQILQTTNPRTPCYILVTQGTPPPFLYMINLPRSHPATGCPVSQTLDPTHTCYEAPRTSEDPAFILNVPLPRDADELDESPEGILKLREAKANPVFTPITKTAFSPPTPRHLGPPSPQLTMAVFKPLAPSASIAEPPSVRNTLQPFRIFSNPTALSKFGGSKIVYIQSKTPLFQSSSFLPRIQSLRNEYPYPSSEGGGSSSSFPGPYPPSH